MSKPEDFYLSEEALAWINELLPGAGPVGAYAMGMATVALHQHQIPPTRFVFTVMREQATLADAAQWLDGYIADCDHLRSGVSKRFS